MNGNDLLILLSNKKSDKEKIAKQVIDNPNLLPAIFEGLDYKEASVKYGCDKVLRLISEISPSLLYPKINFFIDNLNCENNFIKWGAIAVISNLALVDTENKIEKIIKKYLQPLNGPTLITANNVIKGAAKIAKAKPLLIDKISRELLKVRKAKYQSDTCLDIALGQTIDTFNQFFNRIKDKEAILIFVEELTHNSRNATRNKAIKFIKKNKVE